MGLIFLSVRFGTLDSYGALAERGFEEKELKSFGPYITLDGDKTMEFALGIGYS